MTDESTTQPWFSTGYDAEHFPKRDRAKDETRDYVPFRFWLKVGEERRIMFVDDNPFNFIEHDVFMKTMHNFTCLQVEGKECPLCKAAEEQDAEEISIRAKPVAAYTILDLSPWTARNGKTHSFSKRLLVATETPFGIIKVLHDNRMAKDAENNVPMEERLGLKFHKYSVSRTLSKDPRVGGLFEHWAKIADPLKEIEGITEKDLEPVDYPKAFACKSVEEVQAFVNEWKAFKGKPVDTGTPDASKEIKY